MPGLFCIIGISMSIFSAINKNQAGFTVVEILVAIIVGAVVITGANGIIVSQSYLSQRGRDLVLANAFVEGKVEGLRSTGFLALSDGTTDITAELPAELNSPRVGTVTISTYSSAIKRVDISITYNEQGASRNYSYSTLIGELGVGQY